MTHTSRFGSLVLFLFVWITCLNPVVQGQVLLDHFHKPNGPVKAIAVDHANNIAYLGGNFTFIGENKPYVAAFDPTTLEMKPHWPNTDGEVVQCIPDGSGGWFICGYFTRVDGVPRNSIARLNADGSLSNWDLNLTGNWVRAMTISGNLLVITGWFSQVSGQARTNLAAIDLVTGEVMDWNLSYTSSIDKMVAKGDTVFVAGGFIQFGGQPRQMLAAFLASNGTLLPWAPTIMGSSLAATSIRTLATSDSTVYIGGSFIAVDGTPRTNLAALDADNGSVLPWAPEPNGMVLAILPVPGKVYLGGLFQTVGNLGRDKLAAVDPVTGIPDDWTPSAGINGPVLSIAKLNNTIHVGGNFTTLNEPVRRHLMAFDALSGDLDDWSPDPDHKVNMVVTDGTNLVAIGSFTCLYARERRNLCAIDLATGIPTEWAPTANSQVFDLLVADSTLYVGGAFTQVNNQSRLRFAALSTSTGQLLPLVLNADRDIAGLAVVDSLIFLAGSFFAINGTTRYSFASANRVDGTLSSMSLSLDVVHDVKAWNDTVYFAGNFISISGQPRMGVAAVVASTGELTPWAPSLQGSGTLDIALDSNMAYMAGPIMMANGETRRGFCSIDRRTAALSPWIADVGTNNSQGRAISVKNNLIFVAGHFTSLNGASHGRLAVFDKNTGELVAWDPGMRAMPPGNSTFDHTIHTIVFHDSLLIVGGAFNGVLDREREHFAAFQVCFGGPYYLDNDGDGLGEPGTAVLCPEGENYVTNNQDCDDSAWGHGIGEACDDGNPFTIEDIWLTGCDCVGQLPTSINTVNGIPVLQAYPNPVQHTLHFSGPISGGVFDLHGRSLMSITNASSVDIPHLSSGIYQVRTLEGAVIRFVKD